MTFNAARSGAYWPPTSLPEPLNFLAPCENVVPLGKKHRLAWPLRLKPEENAIPSLGTLDLSRASAQPRDNSSQRTESSTVFSFELLPGEFPVVGAVALGATAGLPDVVGPLGNHLVGDL